MQSSESQLLISAVSQALLDIVVSHSNLGVRPKHQRDVPLLMVLVLQVEWIISYHYSFPFFITIIFTYSTCLIKLQLLINIIFWRILQQCSFFTLCPKTKPNLPTKCPPTHNSRRQNSTNCDWLDKILPYDAVISADIGKQQFQGKSHRCL